MKEYRNAVRSRNMIKNAFFELLSEKSLYEITVVDVVNRADISRNTFYAHYNDVYAVLDEMENDFIEKLNIYVGESQEPDDTYSPLSLLLKVARFLDADSDSDGLFKLNPKENAFNKKIISILHEKVIAGLSDATINDEIGFSVFTECLLNGFLTLSKKSLSGDFTATTEEIARKITTIFDNGIKEYVAAV